MTDSLLERRTFIERCALGAFGLSVLPDLSTADPVVGGNGFGQAKRIIFLQVKGGMSHIDTFDPKTGPSQGPGKAIRTQSDFQVTEYLPKIAKVADKISVIRSMTAKVGVHGPAQYFMRTAFTQRNTIKHPNLGAWAQHYLEKVMTLFPHRLASIPVQGTETAFFQPPSAPYRFLIRIRALETSRPKEAVKH